MAIYTNRDGAMGLVASGAPLGDVLAGKLLHVRAWRRVAGEARGGGSFGQAQFAGAVGIKMAGGAVVEPEMGGGTTMAFFAGGDDIPIFRRMPLMAVNAG